MSNYATKNRTKKCVGVDTSSFAEKVDLANLKSDVDKLDLDKLKNIPTNLSNLKSKVDGLDVDKLVSVPVDLSTLSDAVKMMLLKVPDKIPDIPNLATNALLNLKINEVKGKISNITNLATTSSLSAVENKIPSVSNLV